MYSLSGYGQMIADNVRTNAYARALRQAIKPGSVVVDIGTGTGFFAMLACQYGAGRVYALEPDNSIYLAKEMAGANGYADRIEFIQDFSTKVVLPDRADVIVSDMRGVLPFFQNDIVAIADARQRFLKLDGVIIPQQDQLWAAITEAPEVHTRIAGPWITNNYNLDMRAGWRMVSNTWRKSQIVPEQLLVEPKCWAKLDYVTVEEPDVRGEISWIASQTGVAHGIAVWFDTTLIDGVGFSNAPGLPELIYGNAFFAFPEPVPLSDGDRISLELIADLVGYDYVWRWNTQIVSGSDKNRTKADFKQSTFWGAPLSPASLRKQASGFVPTIGEEGQVDHFILTQMNGSASLEEIARTVVELFPSRFATSHEALTHVGELSKKYSS
jgi:protein arginine N-methyltransferase 1